MSSNSYRPLLQKFSVAEIASSSVDEISALIEEVRDWEGFVSEAESHGLSALVLKHTNDHQLQFPATVMLSLRALSLRHKAHADARYRMAEDLLPRLRAAGCRTVFLKGVALSPLIYPDEGLRPMRDIDVLVPGGDIAWAVQVIRDLGFHLPESHPDKYNRDSHQLPNAWKKVDGFKISVEIHHDAVERDAPGHLKYEDISGTQSVRWRDIELKTLGHEQMLHQLCRHLQGRHPESRLKLINVADVVLYSEHFINQIDWPELMERYPHVINTLKCLHLMVPLSDVLQEEIGGVNNDPVEGVGEIMPILKDIVYDDMSVAAKLGAVFLPSDWWLHLYYGVPPGRSLISVKLWRHPFTLIPFFGRRVFSRLLGG